MVLAVSAILGYMLLLTGLAVASPGAGFAGSLISFVPESWRDWAHVPAYGMLSWLAIHGFCRRGWPLRYALLCGILLTTVFGLWTEVAQGFAPGRETSLQDLLHDTAGGMMAGVMVLAQYRQFRRVSLSKRPRATGLRELMKGIPSR
jgi:hypothetical protein